MRKIRKRLYPSDSLAPSSVLISNCDICKGRRADKGVVTRTLSRLTLVGVTCITPQSFTSTRKGVSRPAQGCPKFGFPVDRTVRLRVATSISCGRVRVRRLLEPTSF